MGRLSASDDRLHYSDGGHRWIAPPNVSPQVWAAMVRDHQRQHLNASASQELARPSPRDARTFVEQGAAPALVRPEAPATHESRKPRPRARTGADHSSIAARQRNRSAR
jgi:hypothetical protein